jgi:hypothetical protein
MPQFQFKGTGYVLQSDLDAFVEACQCRNQRKAYEPKLVNTVASYAKQPNAPGASAPRAFHTMHNLSAPVNMTLTSVRHALHRVEARPAAPVTTRHSTGTRLPPGGSPRTHMCGVTMNRYGRLTFARR